MKITKKMLLEQELNNKLAESEFFPQTEERLKSLENEFRYSTEASISITNYFYANVIIIFNIHTDTDYDGRKIADIDEVVCYFDEIEEINSANLIEVYNKFVADGDLEHNSYNEFIANLDNEAKIAIDEINTDDF